MRQSRCTEKGALGVREFLLQRSRCTKQRAPGIRRSPILLQIRGAAHHEKRDTNQLRFGREYLGAASLWKSRMIARTPAATDAYIHPYVRIHGDFTE